MPKIHVKKIAVYLGISAFIYVTVICGLYFMQRSFIYMPSKTFPNPADYSFVKAQQVKTITQDELSLVGWQIKRANENMPIIVWFHGNAQDYSVRSYYAEHFANKGYGVILAGYRGYA